MTPSSWRRTKHSFTARDRFCVEAGRGGRGVRREVGRERREGGRGGRGVRREVGRERRERGRRVRREVGRERREGV